MLLLKAALSAEHFHVIGLDAQGCTDTEIGLQFGITADASRARLKRARIHLYASTA